MDKTGTAVWAPHVDLAWVRGTISKVKGNGTVEIRPEEGGGRFTVDAVSTYISW